MIERLKRINELLAIDAKSIGPKELRELLRLMTAEIEDTATELRGVTRDQWTLLEESDPQLAERLATACDRLAELVRS